MGFKIGNKEWNNPNSLNTQFKKGRVLGEIEEKRLIALKNKLVGIPRSEETRKKISESNRRKKMSLESRLKMSSSKKGKSLSEQHRMNISRGNMGKTMSKETREKIGKANSISLIGNKQSEQTKEKRRIKSSGKNNPMYGKSGKLSPAWRGGISFEPYTIDWNNTLKRSIRERDHYLCRVCLNYGNEVHHIDYNKKNCNPDNLITLCQKCHSKTNFNRGDWKQKLKKDMEDYNKINQKMS